MAKMAQKHQAVAVNRGALVPFLSPTGAWAYGVGTAIGWGSLVVTTSGYLQKAGPMGSLVGLGLGTLLMLIVARNYAYMMNRYPDSGGSYTYASHMLDKDYGFLMAWFLVLAYLAVFWANATSLPLYSRFFLGNFFQFGYLYTIFDYEVYAGEVLLTAVAIAAVGLLCTRDKRLKERIMIALVLLFIAGITVCFLAAMFLHGGSGLAFAPPVLPDKSVVSQVVDVAIMTPSAFIGFESVSQSTEEFDFPREKSWSLLLRVVLTTTVMYGFVTVLSMTAYPPRYDSWLAYVSDLGNLSGIEGIPPFYAASYYLGDAGVYILMASLLALVITSLIGNLVAISSLFVKLARDGLVPERLSELNDSGTPQHVILLIAGFLYFRGVLSRDNEGVYGNTVVVWVFLLALVFFTSAAWMQKEDQQKATQVFERVTDHLEARFGDMDLEREEAYILAQLNELNRANTATSMLMFGMSGVALAMMISNYRIMLQRQERTSRELGAAREVAYRDPLTGVKSKNAFVEWEKEADARVEEGDTDEFSVIVCDVNGLKFVNDTLGHKAGDDYIRAACTIVCKHFKHSPVFRVGGDEFVVVPQGEDLENMLDILARFDEEVEGNISKGQAVVSAGYSIFRPGSDHSFHDVFERADARMYQRKMELKDMGAATRD
jgi:diguanylate cyclase (GGDEF)-like protein